MKEQGPIFLGEPPQDDLEFVLRRDVGASEVQLISEGNVPIGDVVDCIAENCNLDIVCIKGDIIEITESETGANVSSNDMSIICISRRYAVIHHRNSVLGTHCCANLAVSLHPNHSVHQYRNNLRSVEISLLPDPK
jgi:hypothetical protein